jgi:hypothetical protein
MKHIKLFEEWHPTVYGSSKDWLDEKSKNTYVDKGIVKNEVIIAYEDDIKDMSPLHYIWSEYPTYKEIKGGFLQYTYEFYTDNNKNRYFIYGGCSRNDIKFDEIDEKIKMYDWNYARNVDSFVNGADKEDYQSWKEHIS